MLAPPATPAGAPVAFLRRIVAAPRVDECIIWPFATNEPKPGLLYGQVIFEGRVTSANNAVCCIAYGPAPSPEHEAAHSCGKSLCVNPGHVRWATPKENEADKVDHGTSWLTRERDAAGRFL